MFIRILIPLFILYHGTDSVMECTTRGRFPNNMNSDCRGYTMCINGGAILTKYDLLCPEHTVYSHLENQCTNVTSYQCLPHHNCTLEGDYIDPSSEDCTSYIACVKDLNNITTARLVRCPPETIFSSQENICVNETLFMCEFATESPKILQVSINQTTSISNNVMCLFKSSYTSYGTFISLIAFNIIINV
ncbi:unnamed protein product [Euphydryas editha]|uniref:Chitin-binding type-2 domain-containing protein n=1 Tax=Euphydryas editha TaxID=104508 RepID=A0AAU9U5W1_EUPED|nr:unnamed protein product [Euphydryas editha]